MRRLRCVRGGACALWLDESGAPSAVWCFRPCRAPVRASLVDLETGAPAPKRLEPGHVYAAQNSRS